VSAERFSLASHGPGDRISPFLVYAASPHTRFQTKWGPPIITDDPFDSEENPLTSENLQFWERRLSGVRIAGFTFFHDSMA
jgi:hypothetical protein